MFTRAFWTATLERAVKTVAQTLLALWLVGDVALNALNVDWGEALGVALGAALVSVLMSLVAGGVSPSTGPSFGTETLNAPKHRAAGTNAPYTGGH